MYTHCFTHEIYSAMKNKKILSLFILFFLITISIDACVYEIEESAKETSASLFFHVNTQDEAIMKYEKDISNLENYKKGYEKLDYLKNRIALFSLLKEYFIFLYQMEPLDWPRIIKLNYKALEIAENFKTSVLFSFDQDNIILRGLSFGYSLALNNLADIKIADIKLANVKLEKSVKNDVDWLEISSYREKALKVLEKFTDYNHDSISDEAKAHYINTCFDYAGSLNMYALFLQRNNLSVFLEKYPNLYERAIDAIKVVEHSKLPIYKLKTLKNNLYSNYAQALDLHGECLYEQKEKNYQEIIETYRDAKNVFELVDENYGDALQQKKEVILKIEQIKKEALEASRLAKEKRIAEFLETYGKMSRTSFLVAIGRFGSSSNDEKNEKPWEFISPVDEKEISLTFPPKGKNWNARFRKCLEEHGIIENNNQPGKVNNRHKLPRNNKSNPTR